MPSPFPGMNPYLEQPDEWEDFHQRFITHLGEAITALVRARYRVKIETRLYVHELSAEERRYIGRADASLRQKPDVGGTLTATQTIAAPVQLAKPAIDRVRHSWLEVVDRHDRRVVTAIELLSPTNKKSGADREDYLRKRTQYLTRAINFVEIDLLRGGLRPNPPDIPLCAYYVVVSRANESDNLDCWPIGLKERLPRIPIPLVQPDPDMLVDLQEILNQVYDLAGYGTDIYLGLPDPPLSPSDAEWAKQFVPAIGSSTLS